jgi:serine/threonine-protein kinase
MVKHPDGRYASAAAMLEAVAGARTRLASDGQAPAGDEATTVLRTVQQAGADGRTQVLGAVMPVRAHKPVLKARPIRLPSGWLAAILVAGLVSSAWILAAQGSPAPVPQASAQAETPAPAVTEKPAVRPHPVVLRVPDVEGATLDAARAALAASGLTVGELIIQDSALAGDTVLRVTPAVGSALPVGSVVELVVASGSNGIPAVIGMSEADAIAAVQAAGLVARVRLSESETASPGTVIECTPNERTAMRLGSEVELVVATPKSPDSTPSPNPSPTPAPYPEVTPEPGIRGGNAPST